MLPTKRVSNASVLPNMFRLFDDFVTRDVFDWNNTHFSSTNTTIPSVNIKETADNYLVEMAAPGMDRNDFHVELNDNELTIHCEKQTEDKQEDNEQRWLRREFSYQTFQRTFRLNKDVVDDGKINAEYKDGMLKVTLPKKEEAKPRPPKQIKVS